ncbi:hypothetical protein LTR92_008404 [Exophiala xenobiotica]|nr:hypothetical protein LTR92_008404 [Exophiala xenobiotica]
MDSSPHSDGCSGRGYEEADNREVDDTTRYSNDGLAEIVSPSRFQRPSAPRRRFGSNTTSPQTSHAGSDTDSDIIERERMSPIPVSRIRDVLSQGPEAIELFTSTTYNPTPLHVETRAEAQIGMQKDRENREIEMGSTAEDISPGTHDSSAPFLASKPTRAGQGAQEAPATESPWLLTRNLGSPIFHDQGKSDALLDPQGSDHGENIKRPSSIEEIVSPKTRDQEDTRYDQQPDQEEQETQQASEKQAEKETASKDYLEKVLREYELVKSERDRLLEDVDTLRGENAQWTKELSEARKKSHAVENENIQTRLARDKDWKYLEGVSESAMAEVTSVERTTVRLEKENSELKDKQGKLESQLKGADQTISEQQSRIDGLQTELDPLKASEDRSKEALHAQERENERHRSELTTIMQWIGKQRAQQHLLYPVVMQFCNQHLTRLLDQVQSYGIQQSIPPSPYQYQSLGEFVRTPSELAPSARQSIASQSSIGPVRHPAPRVLPMFPSAPFNPRPQSLPGQDLIHQQTTDTDKNSIVFRRPSLIPRQLRREDISRGKNSSGRIARPGTAPSQVGVSNPISQYSSRPRGLSAFTKHSWANSQDETGPNVNEGGGANDTTSLQGPSQSAQAEEAEESVVRGSSTHSREAPSPEATSSAIAQPQSPGLRRRFSSSPPKSPPRSVGGPVLPDRKASQTAASPPSRTDSKASTEKPGAGPLAVEVTIEDSTTNASLPTGFTTFHANIFDDERPPISRSQSLTPPGNSIDESGLRHRRPYSWDLKAHQTPSQLAESFSHGFQGRPSVACDDDDGTDEVSVPGSVMSFGQRLLHASPHVPSVPPNTSTTTGPPEWTNGGLQQYIENVQHSPTPSLTSSSAASGVEEIQPADLFSRKLVRLFPRSRRKTRVNRVQKREIFSPVVNIIDSCIDSFSDICEDIQSWMSDVVSTSDPGSVSTRFSTLFSELDVPELVLDNVSQSSGASARPSRSESGSEKRRLWLDEESPSDLEGEHASSRSESEGKKSRHPRHAYVESCSESDSASIDGTTRSTAPNDEGQSDPADEHGTSYQAHFEIDSERDHDDGTAYTNAKPHETGPDTGGSRVSSSLARPKLPLPSPDRSQAARPSSGYSARQILDRRPSYFILTVLLCYIAVDMVIIVSVHAAPLIGSVWQTAQAGLAVLFAAVWNLTVSVALRHGTTPGILGRSLTSGSVFDTPSSITASMPQVFHNPRGPTSTQMSPSPISTSSSSPGLSGSHKNIDDIPTTVWVRTTTTTPPSPSSDQQDKHNNKTSAAGFQSKSKSRASPDIHVLPKTKTKTREWTGPGHLDFTPGIRRFIDIVRFDVTVMLDAVGK